MWLSNDTVTSNLNLLAKITTIKAKNNCSTVEDFAIFHFITKKRLANDHDIMYHFDFKML